MRVKLTTSLGDIVLALDTQRAPRTVANFLGYVREGFYDGTLFHRVIDDFMIQGGGFEPDMRQKKTRAPIENEADNGLNNVEGAVAMARRPDPHSATSQFFINTRNNAFLDFKDRTAEGWGYCVFAQVVEGMEVVDRIAKVETTRRAGHGDVPVSDVVIERAETLDDDVAAP